MTRGRPKKVVEAPIEPATNEPSVSVVEDNRVKTLPRLPSGQVRASVFECEKKHRTKGPETSETVPCRICKQPSKKFITCNELYLDNGETIKPLPPLMPDSVVRSAVYWCREGHITKGASNKAPQKCRIVKCTAEIDNKRTQVFEEKWVSDEN